MKQPTTQQELRAQLEFGSRSSSSESDVVEQMSSSMSDETRLRNTLLSYKNQSSIIQPPSTPSPRIPISNNKAFSVVETKKADLFDLPLNTPTRPRAMRREFRSGGSSYRPSSRSRSVSRVSRFSSPRGQEKWVRDRAPSPSPTRSGKRRRLRSLTPSPRLHHSADWYPSGARVSSPAGLDLQASKEKKEADKGYDMEVRAASIPVEEVLPAVGRDEKGRLRIGARREGEVEVKEDTVCYNCAGKGHSFMDCVIGCGRCGQDGHKTMDCELRGKGKLVKGESMEG